METIKILKKTNINEMNIKELIVELFIRDKNAKFKTQKEIATAINEMVGNGSKVHQGSISKVLPNMLKKPFQIGENNVYIDKCDGAYRLIPPNSRRRDLLQAIKERLDNSNVELFEITKYIWCFSLTEKCILTLKKYINYSIDANFILDVIKHDSKLYVIINPKIYKRELEKVVLFFYDIVNTLNNMFGE